MGSADDIVVTMDYNEELPGAVAQKCQELLEIDEEIAEEILEGLWTSILCGDNDQDALVETLCECVEDETDEACDETVARSVVEELLQSRSQHIAQFGEVHSRLTAAFVELQERGLLALQDFTCCNTCGHYDAAEQMYKEKKRGYIFFHRQDTESLVYSELTYLRYGANETLKMDPAEWESLDAKDKDKQHCAMVREFVENDLKPVFDKYDIGFEWNGSLDSAMLITNCDYRAPIR